MSDDQNHIERYFKKHLDVEQSPFMEEDWAKMEAKLNSSPLAIPTASNHGVGLTKGIIILILATGLAFILGWYLRPLGKTALSPADQTAETLTYSGEQAENEPTPQTSKNEAISLEEPSYAVGSNRSMNPIDLKRNETPGSITSTRVSVDTREDRPTVRDLNVSKAMIPEHLVSSIPPFMLVKQRASQLNQSPNISTLQGKTTCLDKKRFDWKQFAIGLSWAPDFNSLGLSEKPTPTNKVGLRLFWKPLSRLELQTGVFYNQKKYTSSGESYNLSDSYWDYQTNGVKPSLINGSCSVIDIPITVGYDILQRSKWTWSVSGGLSTYILLDEQYYYEYELPNPGAATSWVTDENSTLRWSIANASVSGEYHLLPGTIVRIEPFLQAPLREVGWGNVSLYGYGVLFTIKQKLIPNKP